MNYTKPEKGDKIIIMNIKDYGEVRIRLFPEYADKGAENFIGLAEKGYYGADPEACSFFRGGWEERIRAVTAPAFAEYLKKYPPAAEKKAAPAEGLPNCL